MPTPTRPLTPRRRVRSVLHRLAMCLVAAMALGTQICFGDERVDFFETHIRPALIEHCLDCHSADTEASGNLLLDSRSGWVRGGDFGTAIVPGNAEASLLYQAIAYDDLNLQMPPEGKLDDQIIHRFRQWIESGAADPRSAEAPIAEPAKALSVDRALEHWAYRPNQWLIETSKPSRDTAVAERKSKLNAAKVDEFIEAQLRPLGLQASPPARPAALLRRLSFDLTGLPPSPEQIQDFVQDPSEQSYVRMVESMLASPAYGETFARRWMDVARYAESITLRGFVLPNAWRYRDYLIWAFSNDRGFDQMIHDQIAGDLGEESELQERQMAAAATGFLAMGNTNLEDQDKTNLEFDYIDEQLETIGRAFLGQTIGCARCHDHKFDPIPTADYYAMAGIFRSTVALDHSNVSKWVEQPLPLEDEREREFLELVQQRESLGKRITQLEKRLAKSGKKLAKQVPVDELPGIVIDNVNAKTVGQWRSSDFVASYVGQDYLHDENRGRGDKTITFEPAKIPPGDYEVRLSYTANPNRATAVQVRVFSANETKTVTVNQREKPSMDGLWVSLGTFPFEKDGQAFVMISNEQADGHVVADAVQFLRVGGVEPERPQTSGQRDGDTDNRDGQVLTELKAEAKDIDQRIKNRPVYLTVREGEPKTSIPIRVRGLVHQHGDEVPRGVLSAIGDAARWSDHVRQAKQSGRRELAGWLTDATNPLPARVYANRVWSWLMGEGFVATENNFGTTGEQPSHPELLDWMASELIRNDWSTKHLVRMIVMSDAYRRSVRSSDANLASVDPDNRLLWRANLKRLSVEQLRDAMLTVSDELDRQPFGASLPASLRSDYAYQHDSLRRGVYQPVLRNSLPPLYDVFDFADSSVSVGQRARSTVATQSLVMMNHPWVIARSQAAAARFGWPEQSDSARSDLIRKIYLASLGREASSKESEMAREFLTDADRLPLLIQSLFASIDFRYLE